MLMGISIVQGGSGYPFLAPSTFSYLSGTDLCSIIVGRSEIPDPEVEKTVQDVCCTDYYNQGVLILFTLSELHIVSRGGKS